MMTEMIRQYLTDEAARRRPVQEATDAVVPLSLRRQRLFRRCLLLALVFIGVTSFVEVVLLPGKMVRDGITPPSELTDDPGYPSEDLFRSFIQTDSSKRSHDELLEKRLREDVGKAYARFSDSVLSLEASQNELRVYVSGRLGIELRATHNAAVPPSLAEVVAFEPTGAKALSALFNLDSEVSLTLKRCGKDLSLCGDRFRAGSILKSDRLTLDTESAKLVHLQSSLNSAKRYVDHLFVLKRERAALARFHGPETSTRE
jgi:hypothetical protein